MSKFQTYSLLKSVKTFEAILSFFSTNLNFIETLNAVQSLNLLANFINISFKEHDVLIENLFEWTHIINKFFLQIQTTAKTTKKKHWHPILGWISEGSNLNNEHSNQVVRQQLTLFWSKKMVNCLFAKVLGSVEGRNASHKQATHEGEQLSKDLIQSNFVNKNMLNLFKKYF